MEKLLIVDQADTGSSPARRAILINSNDLYWLAGIMDGEGSFLAPSPSSPNMPHMKVEMTDRDVIERVGAIIDRAVTPIKNRKEGVWKQSFMTRIAGADSVQWMLLLRPIMSGRRQQQIDAAVTGYNPDARHIVSEKSRKLNEVNLFEARERMARGESLRSVARSMSVNHESLRRRLLYGIPNLRGKIYREIRVAA